MRIIAGEYGGRRIKAPEGQGTRPTTDRTREALMSSVISAFSGDLAGARVLDAFAGTGAFGLEALSRGAAHCTFFERDRKALRMLRDNIETLGVPKERFTVRGADVLKTYNGSRDTMRSSQETTSAMAQTECFDLVFLDPPYALESVTVCELVDILATSGKLAPHAVVLYEHRAGSFTLEGSPLEGPFTLISEKTYGKTTGVTSMRYQAGADDES